MRRIPVFGRGQRTAGSTGSRILPPLASSSDALALQACEIVVPQQLKAYGSVFNPSIGERSSHLDSNVVLQKMTNRKDKNTLKIVKTKGVESFSDMLLPSAVQAALREMEILVPSPIQQTAIEVGLQRKDVLIAAQHGEGKTVAFLAPLYANMVRDRDVYKIPLRERRPRAVILCPSRELITQMQHVCSKFDASTGLSSVGFSSTRRSNFKINKLLKTSMPDVLVMHPRQVLRLIRARRLFIDDLRYFVADEADTMLSPSHDHEAFHLLAMIHKRNMYKHLWPVKTQYFFSTAMMTRNVEYYVAKKFPKMVSCYRPGELHHAPNSLRHVFYPIARTAHKFDVLQHLLKKHKHIQRVPLSDEDEERLMSEVFVPLSSTPEQNAKSVNIVKPHDYKQEQADVDSGPSGLSSAVVPGGSSHGNDALDIRLPGDTRRFEVEQATKIHWEHLVALPAPFTCPIPRTVFGPGKRTIIFFSNIDSCTALYHKLHQQGSVVTILHASLPTDVRRENFRRFASGECNILCATDVAARGLDLHVDLVINFDMPTNAVAYLSRSGRAARMGRKGIVASLFTKHQSVIVSVLKQFVKKKIAMDGISNDREHMMRPRHAEWRAGRINALTRAYVSMITRKTIPNHLEKTYIRHNALWRPLFHPRKVASHGGVHPLKQHKIMDRVMEDAVSFRREQLSNRKGGRAKFGSVRTGVWNTTEGTTRSGVAGDPMAAAMSSGGSIGPPDGPPQ